MTASVSSPADVANLVLAMLGVPTRIGSLYDGSAPAKKILDVYAETRDEILRSKDWPFALRAVTAAAGASTVPGWKYSWVYPLDCVRLRDVSPSPLPSPILDPSPLLWTLFNDQTQSPPAKVILTQVTPVILFYIGQITNMATWEPLFVNAVVEAIAKKVGPALRGIQPAPAPEVAAAMAAMADESQPPNDAMPPMSAPEPQQRRDRQ